MATAIATVGTGFYCVFVVDYGSHDHVFSDFQQWYRYSVDKHLLGIQTEKNSHSKKRTIQDSKKTNFDSSTVLTSEEDTHDR